MSDELECKAETLALRIINETEEVENASNYIHFLKEKVVFTQPPYTFSTIFFHSLPSPF